MKKPIIGLAAGAVLLGATLVSSAPANAAADQSTVDLFTAAVNAEAARYGIGPVSVTVGTIDADAVAETVNGNYIVLSDRYAAMTPDEFDATMASDYASGYQPAGCEAIQAVAIHETGHVIDGRHGRVARYTLSQAAAQGRVSSNMHGYAFNPDGSVNPGEAIAVSFQAHECGSATPTEERIYNLLVTS